MMYSSLSVRLALFSILLFVFTFSCKKDELEPLSDLNLLSLKAGTTVMDTTPGASNPDMPVEGQFVARFDHSLDTSDMAQMIILWDHRNQTIPLSFNITSENRDVLMTSGKVLASESSYILSFSEEITGAGGEAFDRLLVNFTTRSIPLDLTGASYGDRDLLVSGRIEDCPLNATLTLEFDKALDQATVNSQNIFLHHNGVKQALTMKLEDDNTKLLLTPQADLRHISKHTLYISSLLKGAGGERFEGEELYFHTELDPSPKFPEVSDEELLTIIQRETFKYFWDFAHPVSGLCRERITSNDNVTIGGSGFGVMAVIAGIERDFITRAEGMDHFENVVNFLNDKADRFHGAWSHWLSGTTGKVNPFSSNDDGGDLVETAFMAQGLMTLRQYLNPLDIQENAIIDTINVLLNEIEWDWYTQGGQNVLYWHWSPQYEWEKNMKISGWNEAMIVYVMAATSTTHPIGSDVYHMGWARSGNMSNGNDYYGITLPLGKTLGGPLFFSHYSFLGLDPRNLSDTYANYWTQNRNHSLINYNYCKDNPNAYIGYSDSCWGLTASDGNDGYSAHSPTNDRGVITPTAAISSLPYTPEESMEAIRFFYYTIGDKIWGDYGFYDAFNLTEDWTASSFLAIDQGTIVIMLENYRTGLLWDLFMSAPEVQAGLDKLGIVY